jgi:GT2 family glycosyltransferase
MSLHGLAGALGLRARRISNLARFALGRAVSLHVTALTNLEWDPAGGGRLFGEIPDPQIYLGGVPGPGAFGAAWIEIDLDVCGEALLRRPVLYLRRNGVFQETDRLPVMWVGSNRLGAFVADMRGLDAFRFDPSEGPCDIRLNSIRLRTASAKLAAQMALFGSAVAGYPVDEIALSEGLGLESVKLLSADGFISTDARGVFQVDNNDPQMVLALEPAAFANGALLTKLTFMVGDAGRAVGASRLYVDYGGGGFSQEHSFALAQKGDCYIALIVLPHLVQRIRWDPADRNGQLLSVRKIHARPERLSALEARGEEDQLSEEAAWAEIASHLTTSLNARHFNGEVALSYDYGRWLAANAAPVAEDYEQMRILIEGFEHRPRFSFVMPTYNTPAVLLEACIRSMQAQIYPDFEICIADDCSTLPEVRHTLERLAGGDSRIRLTFRDANGHISRASNSALALATGDFVVLMDHDDLVPDYALFVIAETLQRRPQAKILYSDEDKIGPDGKRCDPYFKTAFNEFLMYGHNMVSHLGVYDRKLVEKVGGFRAGYEGSQDYDLFLRCAENCTPDQIIHIPHVLYHWRIIPGSTAMAADQKNYAIIAAQKAINSAFRRRGLPFKSTLGVAAGLTAIEMKPAPPTPVSIIIPTRDGLDLLKSCLASLEPLDVHTEIVIVDNGSVEPETLSFLADFAALPKRKVVRDEGGFNFSRLCNRGVSEATGSIVCLLNNDTELLSPAWLDRARCLLGLSTVGAVGARLVYPDGTLQHFGLVLGMGGHKVAGTPHRGIPMDSFGSFGKARLLQEFSAVTAACMFVRKADYLAVGGFDTDLAVAYNDVDFCLKLRARGLKILGDPEILLTHKESKSRGADTDGSAAERLAQEAALVRSRWAEVLDADPYYSPNLTLTRDDFSLAEKPRAPWPWASQASS